MSAVSRLRKAAMTVWIRSAPEGPCVKGLAHSRSLIGWFWDLWKVGPSGRKVIGSVSRKGTSVPTTGLQTVAPSDRNL
jgi:hypothetical protein